MQFLTNEFYHIYNRGNNKNLIFFEDRNYQYFLKKIKKELDAYCNLLAYCLMPNHYHLLVQVKPTEEKTYLNNHPLIRKIGSLQSSYTRAIQKQNNTSGSLFQQKTKAKLIDTSSSKYLLSCLHYIHQNPLKANLVSKLEQYEFSSFNEYLHQKEKLCNMEIAKQYGLYNENTFYNESYKIIVNEDKIL